ncbi:efflux RND transporter periplasmic adaptor subunit [Chitinophaga sedimenti]|uniref:efflux RND transporter periplasmic adaptor subunit n=1 Tax=Chitinophaga sedimenti TaxID=2033606 RepID=UPI00200529EC|nr:efflux RND transporter periplasmic adaptor subunit [Chitinophaga sedimenti]MCK7558369.1 efflux RND transporter periplasmic adaptor subunit [Chitinophaga sedimenti]
MRYLLCTALLAALATSCKQSVKHEEANWSFSLSDSMMARCEFAIAQLSDVRNELKLFGKVAADNNRLAQVYPLVGGNVMKINVELGDYVKQGQVLAVVRSGEVADFQRQQLDANADVALAEKNYQVAQELFEGKLNSEKDVTAAARELDKAKAEQTRINEIYHIYSLKNGSVLDITAPISGFIVSKNINQNEALRSDKTDALFSIAQIDEVWVLANVNETDISRVAVGYEADVNTMSYEGKTFHGKVDRIFNAIDPDTKAMKVLVRIPNKDLLLKPEMSASVTLRFSEKQKLVAVPSSSIIFDKSKNWTMVFKDRNNIETRQVKVYSQVGDVTYIAEGLQENEKVISRNGMMVYDALND